MDSSSNKKLEALREPVIAHLGHQKPMDIIAVKFST